MKTLALTLATLVGSQSLALAQNKFYGSPSRYDEKLYIATVLGDELLNEQLPIFASIEADITARNLCASSGLAYLPSSGDADTNGCVSPSVWVVVPVCYVRGANSGGGYRDFGSVGSYATTFFHGGCPQGRAANDFISGSSISNADSCMWAPTHDLTSPSAGYGIGGASWTLMGGDPSTGIAYWRCDA